jgi:SAM-dependent methyltransferase
MDRLRERLFDLEARVAIRWSAAAHRRLMTLQWARTPQPEFFDHHQDLFYLWQASRNSLWLERGVFGSLALLGGDVLELACGDGFNARNFYSLRSKKVVACDYDPNAIALAKRKNAAPNIEYVVADIRSNMPTGRFQNVTWDAAIEHFTPDEIVKVLRSIDERLAPGGILSGYTIVEQPSGKSLSHHEREFKSMADLASFLTPFFKKVTVFETIYTVRHNLYFWASQSSLPFRLDWPGSLMVG